MLEFHSLKTHQLVDRSVFRFTLEASFPRTFQVWSPQERSRLITGFLRAFPQALEGIDGGRLFPFYLAKQKWPARFGFVAELAALEWSLHLAEMAPEVDTFGFDRVIMATEPDWYEARFYFDPAHAVMSSDWPLDFAFADPKCGCERKPGKFLIYRKSRKAQFRPLKVNESSLIEALSLGVPLGLILDRPGGPDFDAFLFHDWIESGFLRGITWASKN